jgi:hypothetical protein
MALNKRRMRHPKRRHFGFGADMGEDTLGAATGAKRTGPVASGEGATIVGAPPPPPGVVGADANGEPAVSGDETGSVIGALGGAPAGEVTTGEPPVVGESAALGGGTVAVGVPPGELAPMGDTTGLPNGDDSGEATIGGVTTTVGATMGVGVTIGGEALGAIMGAIAFGAMATGGSLGGAGATARKHCSAVTGMLTFGTNGLSGMESSLT